MEVIPFFLSIVVIIWALYWSGREYRREPGKPVSGLFRYQEVLKATVSRAKTMPRTEPPRRPGQPRTPPGPIAAAPPSAGRRFR